VLKSRRDRHGLPDQETARRRSWQIDHQLIASTKFNDVDISGRLNPCNDSHFNEYLMQQRAELC
jgi:hypothetical protein